MFTHQYWKRISTRKILDDDECFSDHDLKLLRLRKHLLNKVVNALINVDSVLLTLQGPTDNGDGVSNERNCLKKSIAIIILLSMIKYIILNLPRETSMLRKRFHVYLILNFLKKLVGKQLAMMRLFFPKNTNGLHG